MYEALDPQEAFVHSTHHPWIHGATWGWTAPASTTTLMWNNTYIIYMILWYWNNIINTLSMAPQWLNWSPSFLEACFFRNWIDCHAALLAKDTPCKSCGYQQRATWWADFWVDKFHDDAVAKWAVTKTLTIYCIWLYNKPIQGISMNQSAQWNVIRVLCSGQIELQKVLVARFYQPFAPPDLVFVNILLGVK